MMFNKKGFTAEELVKIIIPLLVLIVIIVTIIVYFKTEGTQLGSIIDEFGDCDRDKVANYFDKCPCLTTGGDGDTNLRGCPKGKTLEQSQEDQRTCFMFIDPTSKEVNSAGCPKGQTCPTRCSNVEETVVAVTDEEGEGFDCNCDLEAAELNFYVPVEKSKEAPLPDKMLASPLWNKEKVLTLGGGSRDDSVVIDANSEGSKEYVLVLKIKNNGPKKVTSSTKIKIQLCSEKSEQGCRWGHLNYDLEVGPIDAGQIFQPKTLADFQEMYLQGYFGGFYDLSLKRNIGIDGDPCDGPGDRECYLKITLDSENQLKEGNEENNIYWITISLKNQQWESVSDKNNFISYKSIEIRADDDKPKDSVFTIAQKCQGYVSEDAVPQSGDYSCKPKERNYFSCDGNYHLEDSPLRGKNGCWVFIAEDDRMEGSPDDCGEVLADYGFILSDITPHKISFKDYYSSDDEEDPKILLTNYLWKSSGGSLLCSDSGSGVFGTQDYWELCDDEHNGGLAVLKNGMEFVCLSKQWYPR